MNYKRIYDLIIDKSKSRGLNKRLVPYYTECHHIIPACEFSTRKTSTYDDNLVLLTAKEHYVCHHILSKTGNIKLLRAFYLMTKMHRFESSSMLTAKQYETLKIEYSKLMSNRHITDDTKELMRSKRLGQKLSKETKEKISVALKGRIGRRLTDEQKMHLSKINSGELHPKFGKKHSPETILKLKAKAKNRKSEQCSMFGKKHNEKTKAAMSKSMKGKNLGKIPWNKGLSKFINIDKI